MEWLNGFVLEDGGPVSNKRSDVVGYSRYIFLDHRAGA
jgi:hypothetical protein